MIPFIWTYQCQKAFERLKDTILKSPFLVYPDPNKPYTSFTDTSKYAWAVMLTQKHIIVTDGKTLVHQHPIAYVSGLFQGSQ